MPKYTGFCHFPGHPGKVTPDILEQKHCNEGKKPCKYYDSYQQSNEKTTDKIHRIHRKAKYDRFKKLDNDLSSDSVAFRRERKKQKREMKQLRKIRHTYPGSRKKALIFDQEEIS